MSMVLLGPQLGPVLGPLLGGAITGGASWRWTFEFLGTLSPNQPARSTRTYIDRYSAAITCSVLYIFVAFCLPETLRSIVGNGELYANQSWVIRPKWRQTPVVDPKKFPKPPPPTIIGLLKLLRYPPIVIVSFNNALLFAAYYSINVTVPMFLEHNYGFTTTEVGVSYLAPGEPQPTSPRPTSSSIRSIRSNSHRSQLGSRLLDQRPSI